MFQTMLEQVRKNCPLIHNITNYVTVNDCANIVIACGASPIMADDKEEVAEITKGNRPTIVRTGMKVKIPEDMVCIVVPRSSSSVKYWLKMSNSIGIIDSDYYNSKDNDGEIGLIFENDLPFPIQIKKGDIIGQALILPRHIVDNEKEIENVRNGGYGSTTK